MKAACVPPGCVGRGGSEALRENQHLGAISLTHRSLLGRIALYLELNAYVNFVGFCLILCSRLHPNTWPRCELLNEIHSVCFPEFDLKVP